MASEQLSRFAEFEEDLYRQNEAMNLTRVPREECWVRHFLDSLLIEPLIPKNGAVLDIGAGPGFPAWPLACARPDLTVTALDSSQKMLGFLYRHRLPNLNIECARAEESGVREKFDIVTGRALAPLAIQLEVSAAPCRVGGFVIPMRTPDEEFEAFDLKPLGLEFTATVLSPLDDTGVTRAFPIYEKVRRTDPRYPRRWPEIKNKPLSR